MLKLQLPKNRNYCATVVRLNHFRELPGCDRLKAAVIFGNQVIVSKDTPEGSIGLFFPVETQIFREFLANNNLYRKPEWGNVNPEQRGFFEEHGRVRTQKFRGHKSEGFWVPITSLSYLGISLDEFQPGMEFDEIADHPICKKYIPRYQSRVGTGQTSRARVSQAVERIVDRQFRFHPDTEQLRKHIREITPDTLISISDKWHGTSAVIGNLLTKRPLHWYERLAKKLGIKVQEEEYNLVWSSRRVVKGVGDEVENKNHFYGEDIWGIVAKEIAYGLPKGVTVYGEIVGYMPNGQPIQKMGGKPYSYGCQPGTHRFVVYRVTMTNVDGRVVEYSWSQMRDFCLLYGLEMVKELYYGYASGICDPTDYKDIEEWQEGFLRKLEACYVNDGNCQYCNNGLPAEGIVLRIDHLESSRAYKLKNFRFLEGETKELDKGVLDMETAESDAIQEEVT